MIIKKRKQAGFTIVELLIVIVVIGILAAITLVAYSGISERARMSNALSFEQSLKNGLGDELVFEYTFEDAAGSFVPPGDTSVKNSVTSTSLVAYGSPSIVTSFDNKGKAVVFDGVDDRFTTTDSINIPTNGDFTYSFWFAPAFVNGYEQSIIDRSPVTGTALDVRTVANSGVEAICSRIGGTDDLCSGAIEKDKWYFFTYTRKGGVGTLYLDGKAVDSKIISQGAITNSPNIGSHGNSIMFWQGKLDNIRIYSKAP